MRQPIPVRRAIGGAATAALAGALVAAGPGPVTEDQAAAHESGPFTALVYSETAGFRHGAIPAGIAAIEDLADENGFEVDATEDSSQFTDENLAQYDVVVWLNTTGDVLNAEQQAAFERYIQAGGGYAGVHAASDTEYDWAWYGGLVGAYFNDHPANQTATVQVEDSVHPSTAHLDSQWSRYDEWYNFRSDPRDDVHVLASVDESTYDPGGGAMGESHPIAWCHDYDGGRAWYTGMGHTIEAYSDPDFLHHLLGGLQTASGALDADCGGSDPQPGAFEKVPLDESTLNPMKLDIADDGRVFYIDRGGDVRIIRPDGSTATAGHIDVYTGQEFGMLGLALDPDFASNGWLYLYYSPAGGQPIDRLSRFTVNGDSLDLGSQSTLLEVDTQRSECCHSGGALDFDADGNLYLATGDNTNPFGSDGYTPIDERPGREYFDSQRTSANSNVLNGKVLRIHPEDDGGYTIPSGNLFEPGTPNTRPEIYAMGFRNPFSIGTDPETGKVIVADYGPDAGAADPNRGPDGRVEWNIVDEPGFYGWPYCVGDNTPYVDYDFATGQSGGEFDCANPVNDSPNNTGVTDLPPAIPSELWMGKSATGVPEIGGSGGPTTSGVYRYDPASDPSRAWPAEFDGTAIYGDWNDGRMFALETDSSVGDVVAVERILEDMDFTRIHELKWGPDGALYVIDWGTGFGGGNDDSGIYRIDHYSSGPRDPIAQIETDTTSGPAPLTVQFSGAGSTDPEGGSLEYSWDFDSDGTADATGVESEHTYTDAGNHLATLTVTAADGRTALSDVEIVAGNTAPTVTIEVPAEGGFFDWGDTIPYRVTVTDPEDGQIDCQNVVTQPALGHDEHAHGYEQYYGCEGSFPLPGDEGHVGANIFGVVTVSYTDGGGAGGAKPLTTEESVVLHTNHKEAEYFTGTGRVPGGVGSDDPGVALETSTDTGGGQNVGWATDGDWFGFEPMNLTGIDAVDFRVASGTDGGVIEIHANDPEGPLVGSAAVEGTGDWQNWTTVTAGLENVPAEVTALYFVVRSPSGGTGYLLNVNWMEFQGEGVTGPGGDQSGELRSTSAGRCLDVSGQSVQNGAEVHIWDCHGGSNQQWTHTASGELTVYSGDSLKCLDLEGGGTGAGTAATIWDCDGSADQQWELGGDGTVTHAATGLCLDVDGAGTDNGTAAIVWNCHGGTNQQWNFG